MSTFSQINTAYSGLAAARAALEVTGQNVSNVSTPGYTRQRVEQVALSGVSNTSAFTTGLNIGTGTLVTGITRLNDSIVDANVRGTASTSGYWSTASTALSTVETSLNEPGDTGLSSTLNAFWSAWQSMGNNAGGTSANAAATSLLSAANTLTSRIAAGYTSAAQAWTDARSDAVSTVKTVNDTAQQIASLNNSILRATASGGNPNELMDQRSTALTTLATLTGASARQNANGSIDVVLGGNTIVSGTTARSVALVGASTFLAAGSSPLHLEFTDHAGAAVTLDGGSVAAQLTTLAGAATDGTGGTYAEAAKVYNDLATSLASTAAGSLNALHAAGKTSTGATGLNFFSATGTGPAALALSVVPTSITGIAAASATAGAKDGTVADAIAQLGTSNSGPDAAWATFVSNIGSQSKAAASQAAIAGSAATSAVTAQTSQSGVDLDEETSNLVVFQHAYQAAARVMTTVDQMLDTLINHTGIVGT